MSKNNPQNQGTLERNIAATNEFKRGCDRVARHVLTGLEILIRHADDEDRDALLRMRQRCDEVIAGDVFSEEELEALHNIQVPGPQEGQLAPD